jgi:hypothetical protein
MYTFNYLSGTADEKIDGAIVFFFIIPHKRSASQQSLYALFLMWSTSGNCFKVP